MQHHDFKADVWGPDCGGHLQDCGLHTLQVPLHRRRIAAWPHVWQRQRRPAPRGGGGRCLLRHGQVRSKQLERLAGPALGHENPACRAGAAAEGVGGRRRAISPAQLPPRHARAAQGLGNAPSRMATSDQLAPLVGEMRVRAPVRTSTATTAVRLQGAGGSMAPHK